MAVTETVAVVSTSESVTLRKSQDSSHAEEWTTAGNSYLIVFVHGFGGHYKETWRHSRGYLWWRSSVSFLQLLADDISDCDFAAFRHTAEPLSTTSTRSAADALQTYLKSQVESYKSCILVAHSLGGVICRQTILNVRNASPNTVPKPLGLLMFGSPNAGTEVARLAPRCSRSARDIAPFSDYLRTLNEEWLAAVVNGGDPNEDPTRRCFLRVLSVIGNQDRVVPPSSAAAHVLMGQTETVDKNHRELVKPKNTSELTYIFTKKFILKAVAAENCADNLRRACAEKLRHRALASFIGPNADEAALSEEERIEISASSANARHDVKVATKRKGWRMPNPFRLAVRQEELALPSNTPIHYDAIIGRGILTEAEYRELVQNLTPSLLQKVVSARLSVTLDGQARICPEPVMRSMRGVVILEWEQEPCVADHSCDIDLNIELKSAFSFAQGWYSYFTRRNYLNEVGVTLVAPWQFRAKVVAPWVESKTGQCAPIAESLYQASVHLKGPVPKGVEAQFHFIQS